MTPLRQPRPDDGPAEVILVDTSLWIDHLHAPQERLVELLLSDEVGCHPDVIEELALGSIARRSETLGLLAALRSFRVLAHEEALAFVDAHRLWGRGLSLVDVHLLGSVLLTGGATLWTRDKRLNTAAHELGVRFDPST